ncbi:autotransporter outer membrane beta-barrel domain-containing protein [Anaerosacchariphilus polymeriproducens]|uniref:Uncharacterized protein n=1 Tax=Anaerosacchariphilus polymeriproducens TaxID=1812858 RepID=A0A371AW63_9FIRM|nr:hypothetical protein [Anaerosacchariphilus polymeriproducens]RDU23834.1 hypothetical protein DWV06_08225 [Anaerosacchariphilus polymeriproducens]
MQHQKCKNLYGLMIIILFTIGAGGCASTSANQVNEEGLQVENTFVFTDNTDEELVSTTITGIVNSMDGNEVTLAIGNKGGMMGGTPPDSKGSPSSIETPDSTTSSQNKTGVLTIGDESVLSKDGKSASLSDITEGSMISITFDEDGKITEIIISKGVGIGGMGNEQSNDEVSYDAVKEYTEDTTVDGESFSSTGTDENAILVSNGAKVVLNDITLDRSSSDSTGGDNSSFYGVGAGLLATKGSTYVKGGTFNTDAAGGTGIFSYGEGVTYVADADIHTKQNTSGAIHAAGGGTLYAWNLNAVTEGESSAAIRSDRGGGKMVVDGGTYTSNGVGSPAVYCTADIAVNNATLTANGSEAICMEGLNSIHLYDCSITGKMQDLEQNDTTWTMIVYQSMSGDSEVGNSTMQLVGGNITSENGGFLYTTNTECNILMSDVDIDYADDSEFFLQCTGNTNDRGWGEAGANGSDCIFTADDQDMEGNVIWDSISDLDFYMKNGSKLTGAFVDDETWAGNGGDGYCNVYINSDSTWTVTANSTVTNLYNEGTIVDKDGNTVTILGSDGTVYVKGNSEYTITVSSYGTSADFSGASNADSYSDYVVSRPAELN